MVNLGQNPVQYNNNQFPHEIGNTSTHQKMLVYNPTISQVTQVLSPV